MATIEALESEKAEKEVSERCGREKGKETNGNAPEGVATAIGYLGTPETSRHPCAMCGADRRLADRFGGKVSHRPTRMHLGYHEVHF